MKALNSQILPSFDLLQDDSFAGLMDVFDRFLGNGEEVRDLFKSSLQNFAEDAAFADKMGQVFGEGNDYSDLQGSFASGNFGSFPAIEIRSGAELGGANAAYATATNTIYFSTDFLHQYADNLQVINSVLLEEFGHYIDARVNVMDTPGDEGEYFSNVVQGIELNASQVQALRSENDFAVVNLNGSSFEVEQNDFDLTPLIGGLDNLLGSIDSSIKNEVWKSNLPLVGDNLANLTSMSFLDNISNSIRSQLQNISDLNASDVINVLSDFGTVKSNVNNNQVRFDITLNGNTQFDTPIGENMGLPGLAFEIDGNAQADLGYQIKFGFGVHKGSGFFFDYSNPEEILLNLKTSLPDLDATGELGFLQLDVKDKGTVFDAKFAIDLQDIDNNQRISLNEINAKLSGDLFVDLDLETSFDGSEFLPSISSEFDLDWSLFDAQINSSSQNLSWGDKPTVSFNNILVNGGEFFSNFATPILENIQYVTRFLSPWTQALTADLPLFQDLRENQGIVLFDANQDGSTNLLDLMDLFAGDKIDTTLIKRLVQFNNLANDYLSKIKKTEQNELVFDFGSFTLGDSDIRDSNLNLQDVVPLVQEEAFDLNEIIVDDPGNPWAGHGINKGNFSEDMQNYIKSFNDLELKFPILSDPTTVFGLFLGQPADLVTFDLPDFKSQFGVERYFPVYGPIGVTLKGDVSIATDFAFGFDTYGLEQFLENKNPLDLFNGFYTIDEGPELKTDIDIRAFGALEGGVARGGVGGGIYADLWLDLVDSTPDDNKVRLLDTTFDLGGKFSTGLETYAEIGFPDKSFAGQSLGHRWVWESPKAEIFSFDTSFTPKDHFPKLAEFIGNGVLQLNMGSNANKRGRINMDDDYEEFIIAGNSGGSMAIPPAPPSQNFSFFSLPPNTSTNALSVSAFGFTQQFNGVNKIVADGGKGNTEIQLDNVGITLEFLGGDGDDIIRGGQGYDVIYGGVGWDRLFGGDGGDIINGGSSDDMIYGGFGNDVIDGGSEDDIVYGESGNDSIFGSYGSDNLSGNDGEDYIVGGDGEDLLDGGNGNDVLEGGNSNDFLYGQLGNDKLYGNNENDILLGGGGDDFLDGATGNDELYGGDDQDQLYGRTGDDFLDGEDGNDRLYGEEGNDQLKGSAGDDILDGADGNDTLSGGDDRDILYGRTGDDILNGDGGKDDLYGEEGNDRLNGGDGEDFLRGDIGNDTIQGGADTDTVDYSTSTSGVIANIDETRSKKNRRFSDAFDLEPQFEIDLGAAKDGFNSKDTLRDLENIIGSDHADILIGNQAKNHIIGGIGNDTLVSSTGDDTYEGNAGIDVISYRRDTRGVYVHLGDGDAIDGSGSSDRLSGLENLVGSEHNDELHGSDESNIITGGRGDDLVKGGGSNDLIYGEDGSDRIFGEDGADTIYGNKGNDSIEGGQGNDTLAGQFGDDVISGGDDADSITGGYGNDQLRGDSGDDAIDGGFGHDRLWGGDDNDILIGNEGNDRLYGDAGSDRLEGGDGFDELDGGTGNDDLDGGTGSDRLFGGDGEDLLKGQDGEDTLEGGNGNDTLEGGNGDDFMTGGEGNDRLIGADGKDTMQGGSGEDYLDGGNDKDTLEGGDGNDTLFGRTGDDWLDGGSGDDFLDGAEGSDRLIGADGHDTLIGADGNDTLEGNDGNDRLEGGDGDDRLYGGRGDDYLDGGEGNNYFEGGEGNDTFVGNSGRDRFYGGDGDDTFYGRGGDDIIHGDQGNDALYGEDGWDFLDGGEGDDTIEGGNDRDSLFGKAGNDLLDGGAGRDIIRGDEGNDTLKGGEDDDKLFAGSGDDLLEGGDGNDALQGDIGSDRLFGDAGDDFLEGNHGDDFLAGGAGRDRLEGQKGNDTLEGGDGDDGLFGGTENDFLQGGNGNDRLFGDQGNDALYGNAGVDEINGGHGNDTLVGGGDRDKLWGDQGNDTLYGGSDNDSLSGGLGDDELYGDWGQDTLKGGEGHDLLKGGDDADILAGDNGNDTLYGGIGDDNLNGGFGDNLLFGGEGNDNLFSANGRDRLYGDEGNDFLNAGRGDDLLVGGIGNDSLYGQLGNDTLEGGDGNDFLDGHEGNDLLTGGNGSDRLVGGWGNDELIGGSGQDILTGGIGNDLLSGGSHADIFVLEANSGLDTILDFSLAEDLIGLGGGLTYDRLSFAQGSGSQSDRALVGIENSGKILASLVGIDVNVLDSSHFTNV